MIFKTKIILFILLAFTSFAKGASNYVEQLYNFLNSFGSSQLDISNSIEVHNLSIEHQDLKLNFSEGNIFFFEPALLGTESLTIAAYFEGAGTFQFSPSNNMEREQLKRYTKLDSLSHSFKNCLFLFSPDFYYKYFDSMVHSSSSLSYESGSNYKSMIKSLIDESQNLYLFELLESINNPIDRSFLTTLINTDFLESYIYMYNPYSYEEVQFLKQFKENDKAFFGMINSYSQYSLDESYRSINGRNKDQLDITNYDIDATVNKNQDYTSTITLQSKILSGPARMVKFELSEMITIDSIIDENQNKVIVYDNNKNTGTEFDRARKIGVILNSSYNYGDTLSLTFFLSGKVGEKNSSETIIYAGTNWYPKYSCGERAIFDMTIRSDAGTHIIGSGNRLERRNSNDTLITKWRIIPAASSATFLISDLLKHRFEDKNEYEEEKIKPIDIYFSRKVHQKIAAYRESEQVGVDDSIYYQISEDIMNAIRVYKFYYNSTPNDVLAVTETIFKRNESIPETIMLGFDTWIRTDPFGNDKMYRSREVARQWWGVDIDYETYHDKWITDGLSLYSSLLYIQVEMKNKVFFDKLKEFEDEVYSARYYNTGTEAEVGPVALGQRVFYLGNSKDYESAQSKKSALIFHMLRNLMIDFSTMKDEKFTAMLREFYQRYRGKSVTTAHFQKIVEKYTGINMDWFFKQWVYGTDIPEYNFSYITELIPAEGYKISGNVISENVSDDFAMYVPLQIEFENGNKAVVRLLIDSKDYNFVLPNLPNRPKELIFNPLESVLARVKQ